jgi:hypothetical protein
MVRHSVRVRHSCDPASYILVTVLGLQVQLLSIESPRFVASCAFVVPRSPA